MKIINDTKVYSLAEVAELIGVTYNTALRYVRLGRIPAARNGRGYVVTEHNLMRYLNGETNPPLTIQRKAGEAEG